MILLALGFYMFCGLHTVANHCRISFTDPTILHAPIPPPSHYPSAATFLCLEIVYLESIIHDVALQTGFFPSEACNFDSLMSLCGSTAYFLEVLKNTHSTVCINHSLCIYLLKRHLGGFPVLTVVKTAAVHTPVRFYVNVNFLSFGRLPGVLAMLRGYSGVSLF